MTLHELIYQHGYAFVLVAVLVEQVGVPIPAFAVLVVAGALAVNGAISVPLVFAIAVLAAVAGDLVWFQLGRRFGARVLAALCGLASSPERCTEDRETLFARFGLKSLLVTRFVPGLAALAPSLAGVAGYRRRQFAAFDAAGAALWAGTALAVGVVFHREVDRVIGFLREAGLQALAVAGLVAIVLLAVAAWRVRARIAPFGRALLRALRGRTSPCGCGSG
jgi:membrane protein DedA with SNARE-associated domain